MIRKREAALRAGVVTLAVLVLVAAKTTFASPPSNMRSFGANDTLALPTAGGKLTEAEVTAVDFWIDMPPTKKSESIITLSNTDGSIELKLLSDGTRISFGVTTASGTLATFTAKSTMPAGTQHLALNISNSTVDLWVNGAAQEVVFGAGFSTNDEADEVNFTLGGGGFNGKIGALRIWSSALDDTEVSASMLAPDSFFVPGIDEKFLVLGQKADGSFVRPATVSLGLWHQSGATRKSRFITAKTIASIPDPTHHGQFVSDETYFSVTAMKKGVYLVVDSNGHSRQLVQKTGYPAVFNVHDEGGYNTGQITMDFGGKSFVVNRSSDDFFLEQKKYKKLDIPEDSGGTQTFGEAWIGLAKPAGFQFSLKGCYDTRRMSLLNFSETGCARGFFREPSAASHRYSDGGGNLIIPWGWKYGVIPQSEGGSYSTMSSSLSDVGNSITGGFGYHFDLAGVNFNHNRNTEKEKQKIRETQKTRSYQNFTDRRHSLVVDAPRMRLDQCFIKDVMRASYKLSGSVPDGPVGFNDADTDGGNCDQLLNDGIEVPELLEKYGNHYAYAITYGARMMGWSEVETNKFEDLSSNNVNVSLGLEYKIKGSLNLPGKLGSIQGQVGAGINKSSGKKDWDNAKSEVSFDEQNYVCFGGSGCSSTGANASDDPIPIYLDLRPMAELLGPPYFLDPDITIALRRAVTKEINSSEGQSVKPYPMVQVLDVELLDASCHSQLLPVPAKRLTSMNETGIGPFAPNGQYAIVNFPIPQVENYARTDIPELCKRHTYNRAMIQAVGVFGDGSEKILAQSQPYTLEALLQDKTKKLTFTTAFLPSTAPTPNSLPAYRIYFRLREPQSINQDQCAAPCEYWIASPTGQDQTITVGEPLADIGGQNFAVFPQFELWNPIDYDEFGSVVGVVAGRGVSNNGRKNAPYEYQVNLLLKVTARDMMKSLGFVTDKSARASRCTGRVPDFTTLSGVGGNSTEAHFHMNDGTYYTFDKRADCFSGGPFDLTDQSDLGIYAKHVAAVLDWTEQNGHRYVFLKDGRYLKLDGSTQKVIAGPGYTSGGWPGLKGFESKIIAAVNIPSTKKTYFFLDDGSYLRFDNSSNRVDSQVGNTAGGWSGIGVKAKQISAVANFSVINDSLYFFYQDATYSKFSIKNDKVVGSAAAVTSWK